MKHNILFLSIVALVIAAIALGARAPTISGICLTQEQVTSCQGALDFSDETVEYIEQEVLDGTITIDQITADADGIHAVNGVIRRNLGVPPWQ